MRPFVSHDGTDSNGVRAEVHVQVGEGKITALEGNDSETRNVQVVIASTHDAVKKPIKSWIQRSDPLYPKLVEAFHSDEVINYRTESQRKHDVDRSAPIAGLRETAEIAQKNCISIFAGFNGELTSEAVTNPAEDPAPGGRVRATDMPAVAPAAAVSAPAVASAAVSVEAHVAAIKAAREANLPDGVVHAVMAAALVAGVSAKKVYAASLVEQESEMSPQPRNAHATEAPPYRLHNSDGRINLGSNAVQAVLGAERFALKMLTADADTDVVVTAEQMMQAAQFADVFLGLADRVQVGTYGGGRSNRQVLSHARARALVFDTIEYQMPIPFDTFAEEGTRWGDALVEVCAKRFTRLVALADDRDETVPQTVQAEATVVQMSAAKPRTAPIVEGQDGFVAPDKTLMTRFATLATAAGFEPSPDSPITGYLQNKFGVTLVRSIHAADLDRLLTWYEQHDSDGAGLFAEHVTAAAKAS